jgi:hypothetical protein
MATWSEELPFVLLRLRTQPREDNGLSPAEVVFGAQIVLPNKFLQNNELLADSIIKHFPKPCVFRLLLCLGTILAPTCTASCQPSCSPNPLVWVCRGSIIPPLQTLYDGPYTVLHRSPCSFTIRVGSWGKVVVVSHLKGCKAADATPGSP